MIELTRVRTEEAVPPNFHGLQRRAWEKELLETQRKIQRGQVKKHSFSSSRWKVCKEQLKRETFDKCAYCEAPTSLVAYGDVEHYRPKSTYWWLAYNYDNYLVSCQLCNQKFKKAKFPIKNNPLQDPAIEADTTDGFIASEAGKWGPDPLNSYGMAIDQFLPQHYEERPYLINPYFDNPSEYFAWKADDTSREVELASIDGETNDFVRASIGDYGLNRKELMSSRYYYYFLFQTFKLTLKDHGISPETKNRNRAAIEKMKANRAPFAGMIRYFDQ